MNILRKYQSDETGAVSVEASIISTIMITLTIAAFEICYGFFQWNSAQQAARVGARIAATSAPVSQKLQTITGLENGGKAGDPMPPYVYDCEGQSTRCSSGGFNSAVFDEIVFGPDNDGVCGETTKARRGICDIFKRVGRENVSIQYQNSGLGRAGNPASPAPIITVTLQNIDLDFAILKYLTPEKIRKMPTVSVTVVAEDLRAGA